MADSPFNEDSKIQFFFKEAQISGEGRSKNLGTMDVNRDLYCYAKSEGGQF